MKSKNKLKSNDKTINQTTIKKLENIKTFLVICDKFLDLKAVISKSLVKSAI